MLIGYTRVSTRDQNLDSQRDALTRAGCDKLYEDEGESGAREDRPGLRAAIEFARPGDTIVVHSLSRLSRSLRHFLALSEELKQKGVGLRSLTENIDTSGPTGELVAHLLGALAQFERSLIRARTRAGLDSARARGRKGGRPPKLTPDKIPLLLSLSNTPGVTVRQVAQTFGLGESTAHKYLARARKQEQSSVTRA